MGANTKIEWARHTFNAWVGCTKIKNPGGAPSACDFCYAESWAKRAGSPELWAGERRRTTDANWRQPLKWDAEARSLGERHSVFGPSLADPFDNQVSPEWRSDYFALMRRTPNLYYLLLTKRPQNIVKMVEAAGGLPPNAALGTTCEHQVAADMRVPALLEAKALLNPMFVFLSCEPLLGPINLKRIQVARLGWQDVLEGWRDCKDYPGIEMMIDWVIVGGESGGHARPMHPSWALLLHDQCKAARVPFHFKQWGEWATHRVQPGDDLGGEVRAGRVRIVHPSGRSDVEVFDATGGRNTEVGSLYMARIGKKTAGRLLNGHEHNDMPEVRA